MMAPHKEDCDNRTVDIYRYEERYEVTENKSVWEGEGGCEQVNAYLGRYFYKKNGDKLEEFK